MNLAQRMNNMKLISELKVIDDPMTIVTVGMQSVGKSTVMNRLFKFEIFPQRRQNDNVLGALTKMPIKVDMAPGPDNKFKISVGFKNNEDTKEYDTKIDAEKHLYEFLRGVQKDNPVSENVLTVKVRGPEQPTINAIDLPGIVADNNDMMNKLVKIAKNFTENKKRTIVLFFTSASEDRQNSVAWQVINNTSFPKQNIINIITKPDLAAGDGKTVADYMLGDDPRLLRTNIFLVKSGDSINGADIKIADADELAYYKSKEHYNKLLEMIPNQVGYPKLATFIGDTYCRLYDQFIPECFYEIRTKQHEATVRLDGLPRFEDSDVFKHDLYKRYISAISKKMRELYSDADAHYINSNIKAFITDAIHKFGGSLCKDLNMDEKINTYVITIINGLIDYEKIIIDQREDHTCLNERKINLNVSNPFVKPDVAMTIILQHLAYKTIRMKLPSSSIFFEALEKRASVLIPMLKEDPKISALKQKYNDTINKCKTILEMVR